MNDYIVDIMLDINCVKSAPKIFSAQHDKGRIIRATITSDGDKYDVNGCSVALKGINSDKSAFAIEGYVNTDGTISAKLEDTTLSVKGLTVAKFVLSDGNKTYSTQKFIIDVDSDLEGDITADSNYPVLNRLIEQIHALNESGAIIIDDNLNENSTNAIQNSAVAKAIGILFIEKHTEINNIEIGEYYLRGNPIIPATSPSLEGYAESCEKGDKYKVSGMLKYVASSTAIIALATETNAPVTYYGRSEKTETIVYDDVIEITDDRVKKIYFSASVGTLKIEKISKVKIKDELQEAVDILKTKADKANTLNGYGITNAVEYTDSEDVNRCINDQTIYDVIVDDKYYKVLFINGNNNDTQFAISENGSILTRTATRQDTALVWDEWRQIAFDRNGTLYGKSILIEGDSIAQGQGSGGIAYGEIIAEKYNMTKTNNAVGGTTLCICGANEKKLSIFERLTSLNSNIEKFDYMLIEGGINDILKLSSSKFGTITDFYTENSSRTWDRTTTVGAAEALCWWLNTNYPDTKKLFVLCHHKTKIWSNSGTVLNYDEKQKNLWNLLKQVFEKWGMPYVDIRENSSLASWGTATDTVEEADWTLTDKYFVASDKIYGGHGDGTHPLRDTYEKFYVPLIEAKLRAL